MAHRNYETGFANSIYALDILIPEVEVREGRYLYFINCNYSLREYLENNYVDPLNFSKRFINDRFLRINGQHLFCSYSLRVKHFSWDLDNIFLTRTEDNGWFLFEQTNKPVFDLYISDEIYKNCILSTKRLNQLKIPRPVQALHKIYPWSHFISQTPLYEIAEVLGNFNFLFELIVREQNAFYCPRCWFCPGLK